MAAMTNSTTPTPKTQYPTHTRISPSSLARIMACPGSLQLIEQCLHNNLITKEELSHKNSAAEEGILLHAEVAAAHDTPPTPPTSPLAIDALRQTMDLLHHYNLSTNTSIHTVREQPVTILLAPEPLKGTVDYGIIDINNNSCHIIDYKFGYQEVPPQNNIQLISYGIGLFNWAWTKHINPIINTYHFHIIQPKLYNHANTATLTSQQTIEWFHKISNTVTEALSPHWLANLHPSATTCKYCKAAPHCQAYHKHASNTAASLFQLYKLNNTTNSIDPITGQHQIPEISEEKLFTLYQQIPLLRQYMDIVETLVRKTLATSKTPKHGLKLVHSKGRRSWHPDTDTTKLIQTLIDHGIQPTETTMLSPSKILKQILATKNKELAQLVKQSTITYEGKTLAIVPEDDPRPSVTEQNKAIEVFKSYKEI